jgi:hypothetical protein
MAEGSKIEEFFYKNNLIEKYILFEKIIDWMILYFLDFYSQIFFSRKTV